MKIIECGDPSRTSKAVTANQARPKPGFFTRQTRSERDFLLEFLKKTLVDNRYYLLRQVRLPNSETLLHPILVGPNGIWLINTWLEKGVYRLTETNWEELDQRTNKYKPVSSNPITEVLGQMQDLADHLHELGIKTHSIESVVFFSDPGAHVDAIRPAARVVPVDGLDRFVNTIYRSPLVYEPEEVQLIADDLSGGQVKEPVIEIQEFRDAYTLHESPPPKKLAPPSRLATLSREEPSIIKRLASRFPFDRRQWILLGILLVVNIAILIFLVIVVVIIT